MFKVVSAWHWRIPSISEIIIVVLCRDEEAWICWMIKAFEISKLVFFFKADKGMLIMFPGINMIFSLPVSLSLPASSKTQKSFVKSCYECYLIWGVLNKRLLLWWILYAYKFFNMINTRNILKQKKCFADFQKAKLKTLCSLDIRRLSIW